MYPVIGYGYGAEVHQVKNDEGGVCTEKAFFY
jgi:hypothetical protein